MCDPTSGIRPEILIVSTHCAVPETSPLFTHHQVPSWPESIFCLFTALSPFRIFRSCWSAANWLVGLARFLKAAGWKDAQTLSLIAQLMP